MGRSQERRRWLREREAALARARIVRVPSSADVCVVGAGASGLVAALEAARAGVAVVLLEARESPGLPILATGNGRCNLANVDLSPAHYHEPRFVARVMGASPLEAILDFFGELGLRTCEEEGRLYPRSLQAASVRNVLVAAVEEAGVRIACARPVTMLEPSEDGWIVRFEDGSKVTRSGTDGMPEQGELRAKTVVWACGGADRAALEALGVGMVATRAALCPIIVSQSPLDALAGRKVRGLLRLLRDGQVIAEEEGEILLREAAVSGIPAFDLSRKARAGDALSLDLVPELTEREVAGELARLSKDPLHPTPHCLDGLIDPAIARTILDLAKRGWPLPADSVAESAASLAKHLPFEVRGTDATHPQLTLGGIALERVDPETLRILEGAEGAPLSPGLFASGEALDVDGPCGGYNLSFAWLSGARAGREAATRALA